MQGYQPVEGVSMFKCDCNLKVRYVVVTHGTRDRYPPVTPITAALADVVIAGD